MSLCCCYRRHSDIGNTFIVAAMILRTHSMARAAADATAALCLLPLVDLQITSSLSLDDINLVFSPEVLNVKVEASVEQVT